MGAVTFNILPVVKLSDAAATIVGDRPIFDFTVNDGRKQITSFGSGTITREIRYQAVPEEKDGLAVVKVDAGKPRQIEDSEYVDEWLIWEGGENSVYGVSYKRPAPVFTDIDKHWAKDSINFIAERGIIPENSGENISLTLDESQTSGGAFTLDAGMYFPDTPVVRGEFTASVVMLSGADTSGYESNRFEDIDDDVYAPFIEWAAAYGIVNGTGNGFFEPDGWITREQIAVMLMNYASVTKYRLTSEDKDVFLADFGEVSDWAAEAVRALVNKGVFDHIEKNKFEPQNLVTRGEAAYIIHRFSELVLDVVQRGWVQNRSGGWQYIDMFGRVASGWNVIDNDTYWFDNWNVMAAGKWVRIDGRFYYFYSDGTLAVNTVIEGFEINESGVRKEND